MKLLQRLKNLFLPEGKISDGFHSFDELYHYRMLYNAAFFNSLEGKYEVHKSYRHSDGELCFGGGWFIVMAYLPTGQVSNHYRIEDWNLFNIPERWKADEWDGSQGWGGEIYFKKYGEIMMDVVDKKKARREAKKHIENELQDQL